MFRNISRAVNSAWKSHNNNHSVLKRDSAYLLFQPLILEYRLYSQTRHYIGGCLANNVYKHLEVASKSGFLKRYYVMHGNYSMAHPAQIDWKRFAQLCSSSNRNSAVPTISRFGQVLSRISTMSHLVVPGIFTIIFAKLALAQTACAQSDYLPSKNTVYIHAQDGHAYISKLLFNIVEALILLLRAIYLAILFSPSVAMAPFADSFGPQFRKFWLQIVHHTLERAGPAFIKWGQWAATRPDLFPSDLCSELAKLHSKAPEHSFAHTKRTIETAFGHKISDIFESFEETPVASGSIAQVHRAVLHFQYPGQKVKPIEVAVKVRHPGVGNSIRRDFVIMNRVAKVSKLIPSLKWLRLDESVQQFAVFMMSQVDLAREAAHLNRFLYNFRRWRDVSFPKPIYPFVHPAVLVETYEHGESVAHYVDELEGHEHFKTALAHIGTHALLKMLLVDNFVHADMHPGNILVRMKHGKQKVETKSKPHVVFIDVGMTAELSKTDRVILLEFFKAIARRNGRIVAESTLQLSKQQKCPNPEAFIQEVKEAFDFWATPEGDLVHPADAMQELLEKVRHHKVNIDGNICTVIVTTLVLEGWQRKLDPGYDMMTTLQTLLFKVDWAQSLSYTIEHLMAP